MYYHVSIGLEDRYLSLEDAVSACDTMTLKPRIPRYRLAGEDDTVPRLCVSSSVEQCISAIGVQGAFARCLGADLVETYRFDNKHEAYPIFVFSFPDDISVYHPSKDMVPDIERTEEAWILEPISPQKVELVWLGAASIVVDKADENVCLEVYPLSRQDLAYKCHPWLDGRGHKLLSAFPGNPNDYYSRLSDFIRKEIEEDPNMTLLWADGNFTAAYDAIDAKEVEFYIQPATEETLQNRLHFGSSFKEEDVAHYKKSILKVLSHMDEEVFFNLRHILIIQSEADLNSLCDIYELDKEDIPDAFFDQDGNYAPNFLGITWHLASSVIINVPAITKAVDEFCDDGILDVTSEREICFWQTIFHELRHQQANSFPYEVSWLCDGDEYENAVEKWAVEQYERVFNYA